MENEKTHQGWEIEVKEKLAESEELQLLDLAQDITIWLAAHLGEAKVMAKDPETMPEEIEDVLRVSIGRMGVILDVLQMRYCDCADEELSFLQDIAECVE